jgi:hypothetical protein
LHLIAAAMMIMAVVAVGGRPAAFPDSAFYYSQGEYLASRIGLVGVGDAAASAADPTSVLLNAKAAGPTILDGLLGARPAAYGALLYASGRAGGLWALTALQGLLAVGVIWIAAKAVLARRDLAAFYGLILGLALFSSLPFLAGFAMPDLFAGLFAVAAAVLLIYADRLGCAEKVFMAALLVFSIACHPTHPLILAAAMPVTLLLGVRRRPERAGALLIVASVVGGLALSAVVRAAVTAPGHEQSGPPFLTARILADGPGRKYLRVACGRGADYALCAYRSARLDNAEAVLWSGDAQDGVYSRADPATRARLQSEQLNFVVAAAAAHPLGESLAMARNVASQLVSFSVDDELRNDADFWRHPVLSRTRLIALIPNMAPCRGSATTCANRLPYGMLRVIQQTAVLLALGWLAWRLSRPEQIESRRTHPDGAAARLAHFVILLLAVVLANALVCGALSGPFPRYGARMAWLVPLCAGLALARAPFRPAMVWRGLPPAFVSGLAERV